MGTTTNNGWPTPVATDLVKDGWEAIKDLGDAIDTTLGVYAPSTPGLNLINTTSFSGAVSHSFGSDASPIFTSDYSNYKIILSNLVGATTTRTISLRLRANTTDFTSNVYHYETFVANQTTLTGSSTVSATSWIVALCTQTSSEPSSAIIEIQNPQATKPKNYLSNNSFWQTGVGNAIRLYNGTLLNSASYNGFTIFSDGNISGTLSVYGYNK